MKKKCDREGEGGTLAGKTFATQSGKDGELGEGSKLRGSTEPWREARQPAWILLEVGAACCCFSIQRGSYRTTRGGNRFWRFYCTTVPSRSLRGPFPFTPREWRSATTAHRWLHPTRAHPPAAGPRATSSASPSAQSSAAAPPPGRTASARRRPRPAFFASTPTRPHPRGPRRGPVPPPSRAKLAAPLAPLGRRPQRRRLAPCRSRGECKTRAAPRCSAPAPPSPREAAARGAPSPAPPVCGGRSLGTPTRPSSTSLPQQQHTQPPCPRQSQLACCDRPCANCLRVTVPALRTP